MSEIDDLLAQRAISYGSFEENATVSQMVKRVYVYDQERWQRLPSVHREALDMIAVKVARILTGACDHRDNWLDIAGYATLVANKLKKPTEIKNIVEKTDSDQTPF
jgi:Domain of unknown function (DUF6378)